jgi:cytochrome c oxidase cbb3-type subunit III
MKAALFVACVAALALPGCERETRRFQEPPAAGVVPQSNATSELRVGSGAAAKPARNAAEENAYAVAQGKRLFTWYNCVGCHAHGGGGSGPALMDDKWLYGPEPANVYTSIVEGRPNGMPAFNGRIPEAQLWQLVAYVRSMSGLLRTDVAPGRNDGIAAIDPESRRERSRPALAGQAPAQ